jgi:hypothetical protein
MAADEVAVSVQKTVGDHAVCFDGRRRGSIDVLVEIGGAPDDDHPDHQHESDCKSCEHVPSFPAVRFFKRLSPFYAMSGK